MSFFYKKKKANKNPSYLKYIHKNLCKYNKTKEEIIQVIIRNLIFHKKSHLTSVFIEYLIWDDFQEFLLKYFPKKNSSLIISNPNYQKNYYPTIVEPVRRLILFQNMKKKKIINSNLISKSKPKKIILSKQENYYHILPLDISGEKKIFENKELSKNYENKSLKNESETIDNINANNDISISLDLKINKKYDFKIMSNNAAFVKGKNGENDKEIMKVIRFLKPIQSESIYKNKKENSDNNNRIHGRNNYLKDITKDKNKYEPLYNNSSNNSCHKGKINGKNIINNSNSLKKNDSEPNKNNIHNNIKRIQISSVNNKNKNHNITNNNHNNNILKSNIKKNCYLSQLQKICSSKSESKRKSNSKNKKNIIIPKKIDHNASSSKTNSNTHDTTSNSNNKNNKKNESNCTSIATTAKKEIKLNKKISNLKTPFSSLIKESKISDSNSSKNLEKENKKTYNNKIKKIVLDNKIKNPSFIRRDKYIDLNNRYISPEMKRNIRFNANKNNKLLLEKIIYIKKEKSLDNKYSLKKSVNNNNKNDPTEFGSIKSKKLL